MNNSIFRVISENKGQYIGMFFMVFLSSYLFVLLNLVALNLNTNVNAFLTDHVQGDIEFFSSNQIENLKEIEQRFDLVMDETLVRDYAYSGRTIRLFTHNNRVNITAVIEGRLPASGEIGLDPQFAGANGYEIGDKFYVDGRAFTISGHISLPNYAYILRQEGNLINDPTLFGIGVITREDTLTGNFLYAIKFNAPEDDIFAQARPVRAFLNEQGAELLSWTYARFDLKSNLPGVQASAITAYSVSIPPLLMLLSAVLISVMLKRMITNQMGAIGTLYAMGYRKNEIMRHYLRYPLFLALTGGFIGGLAGLAGMRPMLGLMLQFLPMPIGHISYNPLLILLSMVLLVAILCVGTYFGLKKLLGYSPVRLMNQEVKTGKRNLLEKKMRLGYMAFPRRFSIREQLRSVPRLAFMLIGVIIATTLLIMGFILQSSIDHLIRQDDDPTIRYQYEYVLNRPMTMELPAGSEGISGSRFVPDFDLFSRFQIIGSAPQNELIFLYDLNGNPIILDNQKAVITSSMAGRYRLGVGSVISFTDIVRDQDHTLEITHIADTGMGDVIFVTLDRFNNMMGRESGSFNVILSMAPLEIAPELIYMISTPEGLAAALAEYMMLINVTLYGIAAIAAVIGLIIIYILASISIDENKGNIALMKVFGYKKKEINQLMINGSRIVVVLGFVIGVPVAYLSIGSALTFIFELLGLNIMPRLDWYFILLGFAMIFLAFELSKAMCVKKIGKVPMSEALKSQRE